MLNVEFGVDHLIINFENYQLLTGYFPARYAYKTLTLERLLIHGELILPLLPFIWWGKKWFEEETKCIFNHIIKNEIVDGYFPPICHILNNKTVDEKGMSHECHIKFTWET